MQFVLNHRPRRNGRHQHHGRIGYRRRRLVLLVPMGSLVDYQTGRLRVRFGTQVASVRFLARMNAFVSHQYRGIRERFRAVIALERFLTRVYALVSGQHGRAGETLVARFAPEPILSVVFGRVSDQPVGVAERLETNATFVRLRRNRVGPVAAAVVRRLFFGGERFGPLRYAFVRAPVTVQTRLLGERFSTDFAHVRLVSGVQHLMFP